MAIRTRTRLVGPVISGGRAEGLAPSMPSFTQPELYQYRETCIDQDNGNRITTNPFTLNKTILVPGYLNGRDTANRRLHDFAFTYDWELSASSYSEMPSDSVAATQALARTNPSRPIVDVWTFLGELKDLPGMIQDLGWYMIKLHRAARSRRGYIPTPREAASGFLSWTFGWDPLLKDLIKMLDFTEAVDNRIRELESLRSGDLRRTYTAYHSNKQVTSGIIYPGAPYFAHARGTLTWLMTGKKWVRVRYKPTNLTLQLLGDDIRSLARSLVFGHNVSWATAWELMPWSWLIDWFTTTGDWIAANRNHLHTVVDDIAVMTHITATPYRWNWTVNDYGCQMALVNGVSSERKARVRVSGPALSAYLPFLSEKQWSILSALAITRLRG